MSAPSAPGGVKCLRNGSEYALVTRGGLLLSGRMGGGHVFSRVALDGIDLGSYTAMLQYKVVNHEWKNVDDVTDVAFEEKDGWGVFRVSGRHVDPGGRHGFALEQKISVHPDKPYFLAEVTKVVNIGTEPLDMKVLFLRQYAPYARDNAGARRNVPNLWKGAPSDAWVRASDGAWWGGLTRSRACTMFSFFLSDGGRTQHPEEIFKPVGNAPSGSPDGYWRLVPDATYEPRGTVWTLCICGKGGRDEWERQARDLDDAQRPRLSRPNDGVAP